MKRKRHGEGWEQTGEGNPEASASRDPGYNGALAKMGSQPRGVSWAKRPDEGTRAMA